MPTLGSSGAIKAFAAANGMQYAASIDPHERDLPSLILGDACKDVVTDARGQHVEFGNHGWRYWVGDNDFKPSRRGYIAIQHGLALPHLYFESDTAGALTPLNVASKALTFLSIFDNEEGATLDSPLQTFANQSERLDLPAGVGFRACCEVGRAAEAPELLSSRALPLLTEVATSFDIEVRSGSILAYGYYGDVCTRNPAVWAWVFATASRLIDLTHVWAGRPVRATGRSTQSAGSSVPRVATGRCPS